MTEEPVEKSFVSFLILVIHVFSYISFETEREKLTKKLVNFIDVSKK